MPENIESAFLPFIGSLYFLYTGTYTYIKSDRKKLKKAFIIICSTTFMWQFSWTILFLSKSNIYTNLIIKIGYSFIIFLPTALYSFLSKLDEKSNKREQKFILSSYLLCTILLGIHISTELFISGYYSFAWGKYPKAGPIHAIHLLQTTLVVVRGLYISLPRKLESTNSGKIYPALAFSIFSFAAIDYLCNYGFKFYPPGIFFVIIALSIISYAITKHQLMDIRLAITKTTSIALTGTSIALSTYLVNELIKSSTNSYFSTITMFNLTLFWIFYANKLRLFIQTPLEEKWVTNHYDDKILLQNIANKLATLTEKKPAVLAIKSLITSTIKTKQSIATLSTEFPAWEYISEHPKINTVSSLPNHFQLKLATKQISTQHLILPLSSSTTLDAIIFLGPKLSEDPYSSSDITTFKTIQSQARITFDRIKPYEEIKAELEATKKLAEAKNKENTFATLTEGIAHEIRNPLTAMSSSMDAIRVSLKKPILDSEKLSRIANTLGAAVGKLSKTLDLMLHFGKDKPLVNQELDINETIKDLIILVSSKARKEQIKIVCNLSEHIPKLSINPTLLEQVLLNLFLNATEAIMATKKPGTITLSTTASKNTIELQITDTGIGMTEDEMERIFTPFHSGKAQNTGLGLSFSQKAIKKYNGSISVSSTKGIGTTITVSLPLTKPSEQNSKEGEQD